MKNTTRADLFGEPGRDRVLYERRGGVALLTLNDENLNGYTYKMFKDLDDRILAARFEHVEVIVITGSEEHFCAGANINMLEQADQQANITSAYMLMRP